MTFHLQTYRPHELFPIDGVDGIPIVALGSFDSIALYKIEEGHLFHWIERPLSAKPGDMPAFCFGFGKSPTEIEKTHLLFAYAWGNVIQLVVVIHTKKEGIKYDGYYNFNASKTCNYLCFLSESIIIAVFNQREV